MHSPFSCTHFSEMEMAYDNTYILTEKGKNVKEFFMLKGLVVAAARTEKLERELKKSGLPLAWIKGEEPEEYREACRILSADEKEVLCLAETDRQEELACEQGMFCAGVLNPQIKGQKLSRCRILVEGFEEADASFFQNIHRRALGLPLIIAGTERLLIREMTPEDFEPLLLLDQGEEGAELWKSEEEVRAYISCMYEFYQFGIWVIEEKKSKRLIGRAGFEITEFRDEPEISLGYFIGKEYRRQGYAKEACRAALSYAENVLELEEISAFTDSRNEASQALIQSLGFRFQEEVFREGKTLLRYLLRRYDSVI